MSSKTDFNDMLKMFEKVAEAGANSAAEAEEKIGALVDFIFSNDVNVEAVTPAIVKLIFKYGDEKRLKNVRFAHIRSKMRKEVMRLAELISTKSRKYRTELLCSSILNKLNNEIILSIEDTSYKIELAEDELNLRSEENDYIRLKQIWHQKVLNLMDLCGVSTKPSVALGEVFQALATGSDFFE